MSSGEQGYTSDTGFTAVARTALETMQTISGADIVALYPFNDEDNVFYAPVSLGLAESDMINNLPDLIGQLHHYLEDKAQGKTPDDLHPSHYGPSAWLLATHKLLVTSDTAKDIDSSFVRRLHIHSMIGVPLLIGERIVGLLYLDYTENKSAKVHDRTYLKRIEDAAATIARLLDGAARTEELATLQALSGLVSHFASLPTGTTHNGSATLRLEAALHRILTAAHLDSAALYVADSGGARLGLAAQYGAPALHIRAATIASDSLALIPFSQPLEEGFAEAGLRPLIALAPRGQTQRSVLILADHNPFALYRRVPASRTLLQTAADLLSAMVDHGQLLEDLDESNRTLGAVTRLSTRLLQPGATQTQALNTAVCALTDHSLPELDFEFATIFLVDSVPHNELAVTLSAGATGSPAINVVGNTTPGIDPLLKVPAWVAPTRRVLSPKDIVAYVATRRRAVVVAAQEGQDDMFVTGYPEDRLERLDVSIADAEGTVTGHVHAARLRETADRSPLRGAEDAGTGYHHTAEFTIDADIYTSYGHGSLIRVFVPFGSDGSGERATGILEAGYHISHKQRLERVQIEALRACTATVAMAIQTAQLYEQVTQRAQQLEIVSQIGRAIATSIDLDQTLNLVARNMARSIDASVCLIALLEEDGSAWYGAAASDMEDIWRQRRVERPEPSIIFEAVERRCPVIAEDAQENKLVSSHMARVLGVRSILVVPLLSIRGEPIGAVVLGQRETQRIFTSEEIERATGLANQAGIAINNARIHALEEEEQHIQKDVVLVGFGQWGQKGYQHLLLLKNFFNFRIHVVENDSPKRREALEEAERNVIAKGDLFYWDSPASPAREALARELEPSCYVITYIATPAETHLPLLKSYYELSNVVLIEKPLGAPIEDYREFLDHTDGSVQIVAADHYWFKIEVRLLQLLLTEEQNLRAFLDEIEEIEIEILEEQPPTGSGAQIGMIADLVPHAFAVLSLFTPLDRLQLAPHDALRLGRYQPMVLEHETYARLVGYFEHRDRRVRVTIDVGKGVADAKWIKLSGERRMGGRRSFYKFDFAKGDAIDGTQSALRAASRPIRQPGVPDNAHLSMLRHVIEKKHPAVGILSIRESLRANARIQQLERMANELLAAGKWTPYEQGQRPAFPDEDPIQLAEARHPDTVEANS